MPKYILHGGKEEYPSPMNDSFYAQLALETPENGVCLLSYFASPDDTWPKKFERDSARVLASAKSAGKNVSCKLASLDGFRDEVQNADVIYFSGGNSTIQMKNSLQFADLLKLDKVFAGSSSGAYLMSRKFRTSRTTTILEGTGVLPINLLAHADNPDFMPYKQSLLEISNENCPLVSVHEGQFVTMEF